MALVIRTVRKGLSAKLRAAWDEATVTQLLDLLIEIETADVPRERALVRRIKECFGKKWPYYWTTFDPKARAALLAEHHIERIKRRK